MKSTAKVRRAILPSLVLGGCEGVLIWGYAKPWNQDVPLVFKLHCSLSRKQQHRIPQAFFDAFFRQCFVGVLMFYFVSGCSLSHAFQNSIVGVRFCDGISTAKPGLLNDVY